MSEMIAADSMGPVELSVLAFPGATFDRAIPEALGDIVDRGIVSILDLVLISKGDDGEVEVIELADADKDTAARFDKLDGEVMWLLSEEDIDAASALLEPGSIGVVVVWENTWARQLSTVVERAEGRLLAHDRLDADAVAASMAASTGGR